MVIKILGILFEYIGVIVCIHKIADKKVRFNFALISLFIMETVILVALDRHLIPMPCKLLIYVGYLLYIRCKVEKKIGKALIICGKTLFIMAVMQIIVYYFIHLLMHDIDSLPYGIVIINFTVWVLIVFFKKEYLSWITKVLRKQKSILNLEFIIGIASLSYILYEYNKKNGLFYEAGMLTTIVLICICLLELIRRSAEIEKKYKEQELRMYELYNKSYEETIMSIRSRQHEFNNHINAIKCLQYTAESKEDLIKKQNEYCDMVLQENKFNNLLGSHIEPVIIGFLYSKLTAAEAAGINVDYHINCFDIRERIPVSEFIEILGILLDNAVEALEGNSLGEEPKKLLCNICEEKERIFIEVANNGRFYSNKEIEQFCSYGYSDKGKGRGIGLYRVKSIIQYAGGNLEIGNKDYGEENYLSFRVRL